MKNFYKMANSVPSRVVSTCPLPTSIFNISDKCSVKLAAQCVKVGGIIALPTDTVYGLACNANDPIAVKNLYNIKGREQNKPVAISVADINHLRLWGEASHLCDDLLHMLLPGPVTIVLNKTRFLNNPHLNPGVSKIGIRIPKYQFIQDLCQEVQVPLALTSANKSSNKSSLNINEFKELWPSLDAVFSGGQIGEEEDQRAASTVVDLSKANTYRILRNGVAYVKTINIMKQFNIILDT